MLALDEPTNDLDIETLDLLQEILGEYPGTILLVSHDRDFLDRVATSVIVSEGEGRWREYAGGYSDMVTQRGYGLSGPPSPEAAKPGKAPSREGARAASKRKLSFNDKRALETLPLRIEVLRAEIAKLERTLGDADLPVRDPGAFDRAMRTHANKRTELERAEDDWLALEIRREEIEG